MGVGADVGGADVRVAVGRGDADGGGGVADGDRVGVGSPLVGWEVAGVVPGLVEAVGVTGADELPDAAT